jgi:hypothetical protein
VEVPAVVTEQRQNTGLNLGNPQFAISILWLVGFLMAYQVIAQDYWDHVN